ncbi:MAG TPA: protein kinase, partial [Gemmatimonadales bacterium]|nr:protein kinase [Gemmatimonadales bacterium]
MRSAPDDRLLRLAEDLADGKGAHWDEVLRQEPDLAPALERFRQLQAIAAAHETGARGQREDPWRVPNESLKIPLFSWGEIQVLEKLGEGGYAVVFRAWDPALEREVALKLNRSDAGLSATELQRWVDEARRLARVRHSNILVIHGVDVRDGRAGFWTDLVHGQTLEQVLQDQGRLGGAEALLVGLDLCRALAAVHAAGLVHGDLKSSNVMREGGAGEAAGTGAGRIVLTDFGASTESSPSVSRSAAFATPLTSAPEVLRGEPPSPASDLYSLGVLLYRLVTGRYPIESTDPTELETKIQYGLRTPLRDLRADLGAAFVAVVERALDPDPKRRYSSAGEMERSLGEALSEESHSAKESVGAPARAATIEEGAVISPFGQRWRASLAVTVIAIVIASLATVWWVGRRRPSGPGPIRFTIGAPPHKLIRTDPNQFAISPDGSTLAFIAYDSTGQSLWVRRLGNHKPRELAGTPGAASPFWSPDGKQIGFFSEAKMRRVGLDGEAPEVICDAPHPHGASWGRKDVIVFAPGNGSLFRVPASGGTPESVTTIDTTGGVNAHAWPGFLPDGEHFTYVARRIEPFSIDDAPRPGPWTSYVGSIRTKSSAPLLTANSVAMYAPPHYVIYIRDGILFAQRFDVRQLRVEGRPIRIADSPAPLSYVGSRCGSVSANGVLVWRSVGSLKTRLVWIDRSARPIREPGIPADRWVRALISPDGRRVILSKETPTDASLWLFDFERGTLTGLTSVPERLELGVWSPDSKEILYRRQGPDAVSDVHR